MINFNPTSPNQLLINPRISNEEKNTLLELKNEFEKQFKKTGYFLIASSGSSRKNDESVKLVALSTEKILNSARRFNRYFAANANGHWGLVLPDFHVAGLGVWARAFLTGADVFARDWKTEGLADWIQENKISYISMVPTQIYDLVQMQIAAPKIVKKIFVGASALSEKMQAQAAQLGWPIVETYGMTETASMIAVKESKLFQVLPGVEVKVESDFLAVKCDSLMTASLQKIAGQIAVHFLQDDSWYQTKDHVEIITADNLAALKFLGRGPDYIKILGEGVSLEELRSRLRDLLILKKLRTTGFELLALADERSGYKLVLAVENTVDTVQAKTLLATHNSSCRPYEKIQHFVVIGQIPRTELGKLKTEELKRIVVEEISKGSYG